MSKRTPAVIMSSLMHATIHPFFGGASSSSLFFFALASVPRFSSAIEITCHSSLYSL
jgi:hypothetical protein